VVHLDMACGDEVAGFLASLGVPGRRFLLSHAEMGSRGEDLLATMEAFDVFVGIDKFGNEDAVQDSARIDLLKSLVEGGRGERVVVSHDYVCTFFGGSEEDFAVTRARRKNWHLSYVPGIVTPTLLQILDSEEAVRDVTINNPARFFGRSA
jgi:predicted metal-dependent phosphotriesterase family hydrolase